MKSWALRIYWHMYISSQWMFWHQDFLAQGHFGTSNFWHHGRFSTGYFGTWRFQNMDVLSPLKPIWTFWHTVPKSPWCQNILVLKNLRGQMSLYQNVHVRASTSAELNLARAVMSLAEMVGCQLQREGDKMSYFLANWYNGVTIYFLPFLSTFF